MLNVESIVAIAGAAGMIFGGTGKAILEKIGGGKARYRDEQKDMREELRADILSLKKEITEVNKEKEELQEKYYQLYENYLILRARTEQVKNALDGEGNNNGV